MFTFSKVAEHGSFTAAAKDLGVSKASVSRDVAALERSLGAQLLHRTTRRMGLTEVGEVFLARCQRVVEEAEGAERSVHNLQAAPRGLIRMAVPLSFAHLELVPRIGGFLRRYPAVHVDIDAGDRLVDMISRKFDLALRIRKPREQSFVARQICRFHFIACAAPDYLERRGIPQKPADLVEHSCLNYRSGESWYFAGRQTIAVTGALNADNGDALRSAALAGLGIVYLPSFLLADDVRQGRLVQLMVGHIRDDIGAYAVYPENRHLSKKVRAMIDWLVEEFGPTPDWEDGLEF